MIHEANSIASIKEEQRLGILFTRKMVSIIFLANCLSFREKNYCCFNYRLLLLDEKFFINNFFIKNIFFTCAPSSLCLPELHSLN